MNTTILQNQTKSSKVYQIAVEYSQYTGQENIPLKKHALSATNKLPKILDVDQDDKTTRKKSPFKNIFNTQSSNQMTTNELTNGNSFNIVGRKEVKAYLNKLVKKKNLLQKRNESTLSLSRYSSSVKSQNQTGFYLNKDDVLSFLRPSQTNNQNQSNIEREEHMFTMGSNKSKLSQFEMPSLTRSKQAFEQYTRTWDRQKMKKVKFPSILDHIASYRKKVQVMQFNTLKEKTSHIKDYTWIDTLRAQKSLENFYSDKFVERILKDHDNFCIKGKDKLQKEMRWIDEKDRAGYTFAFLNSIANQSNKLSKDESMAVAKEQNMVESKLNRTFARESLIQKSKEPQILPNENVMVKNNTLSIMKGVLRQSSIGKWKSHKNKVGLSQFSNTGGDFSSVMIGEEKDLGPEMKSVRIR